MILSELFNSLDLDKDGELSRSELHESAQRMGWHWKEAPILAVLDLFSVLKPISRNHFIAHMTQISEDPHGPYGKVLLNSPLFLSSTTSKRPVIPKLQSAYETALRHQAWKQCIIPTHQWFPRVGG